MNKAKRISNRLKQIWKNTNESNWDALEEALKSAKNLINDGVVDSDLVEAYLTISEAYKQEFNRSI